MKQFVVEKTITKSGKLKYAIRNTVIGIFVTGYLGGLKYTLTFDAEREAKRYCDYLNGGDNE